MTEEEESARVEARFNAIVEEFGQFLRQAIARLCPRDLGIQFDDIEQEARLRLWRALHDEREIRDLASYIYRIAATATIDAVRRAKARREDQFQDAEGEEAEGGAASPATAPARSPVRLAEHREVILKIEEAIARLSENRRRAVGLHLQGLTSQEIADLMGWTEPKARNLVSHGLQELRAQLRAEGVAYEIN